MVTMNEIWFSFAGWHWQSDWNGHEVGYPEIPVVGLYSKWIEGVLVMAYVNVEELQILTKWEEEFEDESVQTNQSRG